MLAPAKSGVRQTSWSTLNKEIEQNPVITT